jgi:DNA repair protein RecO
VDLLDHCEISYFSRRGSRALAQLGERRMLSHHPVLRQRLDLLLAGDYLVELLRALAPEGQRVVPLFELSLAYLGALDADPSPAGLAATVFALQGGILRLTGFELVLERCVSCNRRPDGVRLLRCDPQRGGVICRSCRTGQDHSFDLHSTVARSIQAFRSVDPRRMADVTLPPDIEQQMKRFYDRVLLHVLERPTRCSVLPRSA